jgi:hypothetical protein
MIDAFLLYGPETAYYDTFEFQELPSPSGGMLSENNHGRALSHSLQDLSHRPHESILALR